MPSSRVETVNGPCAGTAHRRRAGRPPRRAPSRLHHLGRRLPDPRAPARGRLGCRSLRRGLRVRQWGSQCRWAQRSCWALRRSGPRRAGERDFAGAAAGPRH